MALPTRKPNPPLTRRYGQRETGQETSPLTTGTLWALLDHGNSVHRVHYREPRQQNAINRDGRDQRRDRPQQSPPRRPSEADGLGIGRHIRPGEDQRELGTGQDCVGHLHNNAFLHAAPIRDQSYLPRGTEPCPTIRPRSVLHEVFPSICLLDVCLHTGVDFVRVRDALETAPSCICGRNERAFALLPVQGDPGRGQATSDVLVVQIPWHFRFNELGDLRPFIQVLLRAALITQT